MIVSCHKLEEKLQECSKSEGVVPSTSVGTLGVDLRTRTKQLGATAHARRQKCDVRFSFARRNRVLQKNFLRIGVRKMLRMGMVLANVWEGQAVDRKAEVEEQTAAGAGHERVGLTVSFLGGE